MLSRAASLLCVTVAISACAGDRDTPTAPDTQPLPLQAGTYVLLVSGDSFACNDIFLPQTGTAAQALASAAVSGAEWIFRQTNPSGGDFELRLREGGTAQTPSSVPVTGTIRGQIIDSFSATFPPTGSRASFQSVQLNGELAPGGRTVEGRFTGQVIFTRANLVSVCPPGAVAFRLSWLVD